MRSPARTAISRGAARRASDRALSGSLRGRTAFALFAAHAKAVRTPRTAEHVAKRDERLPAQGAERLRKRVRFIPRGRFPTRLSADLHPGLHRKDRPISIV